MEDGETSLLIKDAPSGTRASAWSSRFGAQLPVPAPVPGCAGIRCAVRGCRGVTPSGAVRVQTHSCSALSKDGKANPFQSVIPRMSVAPGQGWGILGPVDMGWAQGAVGAGGV